MYWYNLYQMAVTTKIWPISVKNSSDSSFADFMKRRVNTLYLFVGLGISMALWIVFKLFYPYPNLVLDSYYYIQAASLNLGVNAWPIGYSKFIQIVSWVSHSANLLVSLQYIILQGCNLFFFFTLLFFFNPGKAISLILYFFILLNPVFLFLSNLILSDALFTGLSILWVTQLLWIIQQPKAYMALTHAALLLITFTIRYNALYYPFIAILAFILSSQSFRWKIAGIAIQFLLLISFILYTSNKTAEIYKARQFSPFGNWRIANNALYMYAHIRSEERKHVPLKFQGLDIMVRRYFDYTHDDGDLLKPDFSSGGYYVFSTYSPLVQYMYACYGKDSSIINLRKWAFLGPLYGSYGSYLIRKYPTSFARYFIFPNLRLYLVPPIEVLESDHSFYLREDELGLIANKWFGLTTITVKESYINLRTTLISPYQLLIPIMHVIYLLCLIGFVIFKLWRAITRSRLCLFLIVTSLWIGNLCFSIVSAAVVFRYEVFIMIVGVSFSSLFIEMLYHNDAPTSPVISPSHGS